MPIFGAFGAVERALDNKGAVALFALMDAFAAEIVIGDTVTVIQEKCPFLFSLFTHSWHRFSSFLRGGYIVCSCFLALSGVGSP